MKKSLAEFEATLSFTTPKAAEAIAEAVTPEIIEDKSDRYHIQAHSYRNYLILKIDSHDLIALRAAINAYLRYVNTWSSLLSSLEAQK